MPKVPNDTAVVVRGGALGDPSLILESILDALEDGDGPVLSVFVGERQPGESLGDLVYRICVEASLPHSKIRTTEAKKLNDAGFTLEHSVQNGEADCHHHVVFTESPSIVEVQKFIDCFEPPILNPTGGNRRPK